MSEQKSIIAQAISEKLLNHIDNICDSQKQELITNTRRADALSKKFKKRGFRELGCGTNRIVFEHPDYPDYAFKVALDRRGVMDNDLENKLCNNNILHNFVAYNYESNGLVSVAEKIQNIEKFDLLENHYDTLIMKNIEYLQNYFILNDIGPKVYRNWGINKEGKLVINDYAYVEPLDHVIIQRCNKCGGELKYNEDLTKLVCCNKKCKKEFTFSEVTGGIYGPLAEMGFITVDPDINNDNIIDKTERETCCSEKLDGFI